MSSLRAALDHEPVELNFGTSGLRGVAAEMTDLECYINAAGFLQFLVAEGHLQKGGPVLLAGDLRDSTPRIMRAMHQAITDGGFVTEYHGLIPTPALAYHALEKNAPCIMVTGSHIPKDRNGIKFYKADGEVLKEDEQPIKDKVALERTSLYDQDAEKSAFDASGMLKSPDELPAENAGAATAYRERYTSVFPADCLKGKKLVFYQHSAVGRDMLVELFEALGAEVVPVGRSDVFIPIDSENVTPKYLEYFKQQAAEHPDMFALVSTDGDSDRPFVVDHTGTFHRGDVLGAVVATWLKADATAYPVSASDASDDYLAEHNIPFVHTKIGSPYVIKAMMEAAHTGKSRSVSWEVNGGFILGESLSLDGGVLKPLPTRDAFLPILVALLDASEQDVSVQELFSQLPQRYTGAGLIDNFPIAVYKRFVERYGQDTSEVHKALSEFFTKEEGFGNINVVNSLDGVRIYFDNGDIAHLRESSNAPQLRMYSIAATQERADEIVALAIKDGGIFRRMEAANQD